MPHRSQKIRQFLRNAALCRKMAEGARSPHRATFLDLAQHWTAMAELEMRVAATAASLEKNLAMPTPATDQRAA